MVTQRPSDPEQSGESLRFALREIPKPMVFAAHRIIRDCNEEFAGLFGYRREEIVGTSFSKLYPGVADFVRIGHLWRTHLTGGATFHDERVMAGAAGRRFWCRVTGRSAQASDPFAAALYCFEPMSRPVGDAALTPRQRQILSLLAQGRTSAAIAAEMSLSTRTVEAHRLRLSRRLGLANTAALVAWFCEQDA
ncbi:PAS and helix-turn-helix domain-containing protein [Mangrovicella endophytica]|uniref:PAS and helix-turn-helix domain-containing protein n=1 Tax=Mangrovicella endophytica TaxID=2066697 RepID=UPI000C9DC6F1|nr:PAS and helix-turn-helix domain-containing protein [Mangrovicella endophytica]